MADISGYLEAIDNAIKGVDVRDSIHDAIEAINVENETLHTQIAEEVIETMDDTIAEYMQDITLLFKYDPKSYSDNYVHLDETMSYSDIFNTEQIGLEWNEENVTTSIYYGYLKCIAKQYATTNTNNIGYLYFYNTHSHKLIEVIITVDGGNMFQFNEIDIGSSSGGSGGGGDSEVFLLQFTLDSNKDVTCNRSSTEAEAFMDSKYGAANWTWNDFWKEAIITLYNEYEYWNYEMGRIASNPEVVMALSHIDLVEGYLYFSTNYVQEMAGDVDDHRTCVSFEWDLYNWTTSDHSNNVVSVIYGGLEAGPGIDISANAHLPGTGILTNVISVSYDNGDTEEY